MKRKIVLTEIQSKPVSSIVEILEEALKQAKEGRLRAVALVLFEKGGIMGTRWEMDNEFDHRSELTAGAAQLQYRLCKSILSEIDD